MVAVENYADSLSNEATEQSFSKLQYLYGGPGVVLDKIRYLYKLPSEQRIDDVCKQSPVEFCHSYVRFMKMP